MEAVTAGSRHAGKPLLLPRPQCPCLFNAGRVAVAPCSFLAMCLPCGPTHVGSALPSHPRTWGNPYTITLIAYGRW